MGDPHKLVRKYEPPRHPWEKERIEEENALVSEYGLKNKQEIWRAKAITRKYRHLARQLVGLPSDEKASKEEKLISKLVRMGLLKPGATLDDVLSMRVSDVLNRRLQTQVWRSGMAKSIGQSRQFVTHGHIALNGARVTSPGALLSAGSEEKIRWYSQPIVTIESKKQQAEAAIAAAKAAESTAVKAGDEEATEAVPDVVKELASGDDGASEKISKAGRKKLAT
ncbi:30S ribosomal protein S4 [Candidatus Micrarchaeota archaeon]|nr:30S ribosomal protein S4 [Candidatus Micrarchaeota archaeon]